ncbi:MAG: 3'(2'),5'-bisphosphate nucleotidase CysQ [Deltaproteobacteria bacterium]|nr:3'(2'),5'-bisphosphate nucleotidase CysQ [Deltaproteobacteria bacterium]
MVSLSALRSVLESAAEIVRGLYGVDRSVERKDNGTPLTLADQAANRLLQRELTGLFPAAWLSEESADNLNRLRSEWLWVVDPLDGTKEFARGISEFALSIGLVRGEEVALGGVMNPITNEGGVGRVGGAVSCWGLSPNQASASVSRSEVEDGSVVPYLSLVGRARPVGSVAYKLLRVAAGVEDLTFSVQPKSEWDVCGGVALLAAAGKVYRRFDGRRNRFNQQGTRIGCGAVAGSVPLVDAFLERMASRKPVIPC